MEPEIRRSDRKTMAIEVTRDGRILLRLPRRVSYREGHAFFEAHRAWVETALKRQQAWQAAHPEPDEATRLACIRRAKEILPPRIARYAAELGVAPAGLTVTGARTRFGSCSAKNRLSFSWRLMLYPETAIDYVVVHELCHILHKNHGPAFYRAVESILPDYRERKKLLR